MREDHRDFHGWFGPQCMCGLPHGDALRGAHGKGTGAVSKGTAATTRDGRRNELELKALIVDQGVAELLSFELRERASHCRRLAQAIVDEETRKTLRSMADELENHAAELEAIRQAEAAFGAAPGFAHRSGSAVAL